MRFLRRMAVVIAVLTVFFVLPVMADVLNVFELHVDSGEIIGGAYQIKVGETLGVTVEKSGTWENATVAWSSEDPTVAGVADGTISALKAGECRVVATATVETTGENTSASLRIRVIDPVVTTVSVRSAGEATSVIKGETLQLYADTTPDGVGVTWSSSRPAIIAVDSDGLVSGIKKGKSVITATANDASGASDSITISVSVMPKTITLNYPRVELYTGGITSRLRNYANLKAAIKPAAADKTVVWTSSDPETVKVGAKGKIFALKKGTSVITATTVNGLKAKSTVSVAKLPTSVWLPAIKKVYVGKKLNLGDYLKIDGDITTVVWRTSDRNIATVNSKGVVSGVWEGQCRISATAVNGKKDICVVNVYASKDADDEAQTDGADSEE